VPNSKQISELKFLKHTSILHNFKDTLVVNPASVSDFKKALRRKYTKLLLGQSQVTEKHRPFSSQREESQKTEIERKLITNF
jgi:hypothetical protein